MANEKELIRMVNYLIDNMSMWHINYARAVLIPSEVEKITPYIEAIYADKMSVIVVEYTFYNEEGIRMLGQYPIGEVM